MGNTAQDGVQTPLLGPLKKETLTPEDVRWAHTGIHYCWFIVYFAEDFSVALHAIVTAGLQFSFGILLFYLLNSFFQVEKTFDTGSLVVK